MKEFGKLLKGQLQKEFSWFPENPYFEEWIDVYTSLSSPSSTYIISLSKQIA